MIELKTQNGETAENDTNSVTDTELENSAQSDITDFEARSIELLDAVSGVKEELDEACTEVFPASLSEEENDALQKRIDSYKRGTTNIRKAYIKSLNISDEYSTRWHDLQRSKRKNRLQKIIPAAPANSTIDLREEKDGYFARGKNIYKLLIICYAGSFFGVVIELLWCLLTKGYLESRSGLVYGPFNLLYGAGALMITAFLYRFRNHSKWYSFIGTMLFASILEYFCSWGMELVLGSRSWDYSMLPFNINGRICLLYSVMWGFLGVLWIKDLYPRISSLMLRIPNRVGKIATWVLTVFFVFNFVVSMIALYRWSQRVNGIEAANAFWEWIDLRFPNERMEGVYANMNFN